MANAKDLSAGKLYQSISASTTNILVYVGDGGASTIKAVWPTPPFYATIMPANPSAGSANSMDSEIIKVTAVGNDQVGNTALTATRGQKGTTAKAFNAGAIVVNGVYSEDMVFLGEETEETEPTPWITAQDIIKGAITDIIYPVGSIYMSATLSTAAQVKAQLGGTWVAWGSGRVPVGVDTSQTEFNTVGKTGGEKTHILTTSEMPTHNHPFQYTVTGSGGGVNNIYGFGYIASANGTMITTDGVPPTTGELRFGTKNRGDGQSHNNLQPYITCYMYKRTA